MEFSRVHRKAANHTDSIVIDDRLRPSIPPSSILRSGVAVFTVQVDWVCCQKRKKWVFSFHRDIWVSPPAANRLPSKLTLLFADYNCILDSLICIIWKKIANDNECSQKGIGFVQGAFHSRPYVFMKVDVRLLKYTKSSLELNCIHHHVNDFQSIGKSFRWKLIWMTDTKIFGDGATGFMLPKFTQEKEAAFSLYPVWPSSIIPKCLPSLCIFVLKPFSVTNQSLICIIMDDFLFI